ncbi:hypothetical protein GCM10023080_039740 [Streptomyces pseudoechinosporeus]
MFFPRGGTTLTKGQLSSLLTPGVPGKDGNLPFERAGHRETPVGGSYEHLFCEKACGMAIRDEESDGIPECSQRRGDAAVGSLQSAAERVSVVGEVVELLLSRADLVSQLLVIGYARDPQEQGA